MDAKDTQGAQSPISYRFQYSKPDFLRQFDARDQLFIVVFTRVLFFAMSVFALYQERNAVATFCHRRTKRKRLSKRSIDIKAMLQCKWT